MCADTDNVVFLRKENFKVLSVASNSSVMKSSIIPIRSSSAGKPYWHGLRGSYNYFIRCLIICKQTTKTQQSTQQESIMYRRTLTLLFSTLVLATALPASVLAQSYPSKPIKFIVPYAAGGLPETVARVAALRLT